MPNPNQSLPLAKMGDDLKMAIDLHKENARGVYDACVAEIARKNDLLSRLSDFMRRCNPDKAKPGEDATNDEWDAIEAEVNAAIGGPVNRTEMDHG